MTTPTPVVKPAAPAPAAVKPTPKPAAVKPVKAVHRINGTVLPDTIFTPETQEQRRELFELEAVVELTDDEAKLFTLSASDSDVIE